MSDRNQKKEGISRLSVILLIACMVTISMVIPLSSYADSRPSGTKSYTETKSSKNKKTKSYIKANKSDKRYRYYCNGNLCTKPGWYTTSMGNKVKVGKNGVVVQKYITKTGRLYNYKNCRWVPVKSEISTVTGKSLYYFNKSGVICKKTGWYTTSKGDRVQVGSKGRVVSKYTVSGSTKRLFKYNYSKCKWISVKSEISTVTGKSIYYFDKNGKMNTTPGWYTTSNGNRVLVGSKGRVVSKYITKTRKTYNYDYKNFKWVLPEKTDNTDVIDQNVYYDENGNPKNGLYKESDNYYRVYKDGKKVQKAGWVTIDENIKVKINSKGIAWYKQEKKDGDDYISEYNEKLKDYFPLDKVPITLSDGKLHTVGDNGLLCTKKTMFLSQGWNICVTDDNGIFLKKYITYKDFNELKSKDKQEKEKNNYVLFENVDGKLVKVRSQVRKIEAKVKWNNRKSYDDAGVLERYKNAISLVKDNNLYFFDYNGKICKTARWYTDIDGNKIQVGKEERVVRKYVVKTKQLYKYDYNKDKWVKETGVSKCKIENDTYYFDKAGKTTKIVKGKKDTCHHSWFETTIYSKDCKEGTYCNTCGADISIFTTSYHQKTVGNTVYINANHRPMAHSKCEGGSHGGDEHIRTRWCCDYCYKEVITKGNEPAEPANPPKYR